MGYTIYNVVIETQCNLISADVRSARYLIKSITYRNYFYMCTITCTLINTYSPLYPSINKMQAKSYLCTSGWLRHLRARSTTVMVLICWLTDCWVDHLGGLKVGQG